MSHYAHYKIELFKKRRKEKEKKAFLTSFKFQTDQVTVFCVPTNLAEFSDENNSPMCMCTLCYNVTKLE